MIRTDIWANDNSESKVRNRGLPWIMPSGKLSGSVYQTTTSTAYQWFGTTLLAVNSRLKVRNRGMSKPKRKSRHQLMMIAAFYVSTNDEYTLERLLNCYNRDFTRVYVYHTKSVDDKTRFLIDQAVDSASWFQLRAPNARAKSTLNHLRFRDYRVETVLGPDSLGSHRSAQRRAVHLLSDPWIVKNCHHTKSLSVLAI